MKKAILLILLASLCPTIAHAASPTLTRGPYLQSATPSSIHIVWRISGESKPVLRYGKTSANLDLVVDPANIKIRRQNSLSPLHSAPAGTVQYEARIEGLEAASKYFYAVYDDDKRLAGEDDEHFFRTNPPQGGKHPFRFWVVGDSGTGDSNQAAVYEGMKQYVAKENQDLDFLLHVGDMAYPKGTDAEFQKKFFDVYQPTLQRLTCWPAMGNHEGYTSKGLLGQGPYYDAYICPQRGEAGGLPSACEAYYSFDYANAHFICLDSHDLDRSPSGIMAKWLRADLEKTKSDWLVAFFHHPPYTKGSHDSDREEQLIEMRELIMPILESGGVDLVLTGHSHIYERSMLIDGAYQTPTTASGVVVDDGDGDPSGDGAYRKSEGLHPHQGVIQVVTGNGGAKVARRGTSPVMKRVVVEHGSVIVDVSGDTLTGIMVNRESVRRDLFSIVKRGTVSHRIVASPKQLPPYQLPVKKATAEPQDAIGIPTGAVALIEKRHPWDYLAGIHAPENWTAIEFIPEAGDGWKQGAAGIGYGDDDDVTSLPKMKGKYSVVYARTEFELQPGEKNRILDLGIAANYDDGFIVYLNGTEVLRVGVAEGRGASAKKIISHEARGFEYFSLKEAIPLLQDDDNILAIEGHNNKIGSSDFSLDPYLVAVMEAETKIKKSEAKDKP
jgi:acid phosphatase type 7